jgi:hypothetical protein
MMSMIMLAVTACGPAANNNSGTKTNDGGDGYFFTYMGTRVLMNEKTSEVLTSLGKYKNYFESEACAYQGLEKTYTYNGFALYTYPKDGVDYVLSVVLLDDTLSTPEGISIGASEKDVIAKYGNAGVEEKGSLKYTKDKSTITFIIKNNEVDSIEYTAITK